MSVETNRMYQDQIDALKIKYDNCCEDRFLLTEQLQKKSKAIDEIKQELSTLSFEESDFKDYYHSINKIGSILEKYGVIKK